MARWLITGCSTGFGREIARAALDAGHSVVVTARRADAVQDFADEYGDRALAVALDVTDAGQITAAVSAADEAFGGIDVLVNNAGHGYLSSVEEGEDAEVRKLFDVNYFGAVDMIKAVLPAMRARGSGHIINISSMTGLVANPPNAYYSSTKFALEAVTEALATEVRPLGIKVTAHPAGRLPYRLGNRSMKESGSPIADYADVAARKDLIKQFADHLPGDPQKVAEAVLMVTTLDEPPLRLLLGRDVLKAMRDKIAAMSASIEEWKAVTKDVNFPDSLTGAASRFPRRHAERAASCLETQVAACRRDGLGQPPIDRVGAHPGQQLVGAAERTRAEEPARRRQRRGVRRLDRNAVALRQHRFERRRVAAPQDRHHRLRPRGQRADGALGDRFPALAAVRRRVARTNREDPVQQQHAALRPGRQVAARGLRVAQVGGVLAEDVGQTAGQRTHIGSHRKAQPHRMPRRRVGILPDDQHPHAGRMER